MHRTPAGLPLGMPGMGEDIEGAIQHAPQFLRHFIFIFARVQNLKLQIIHYLHFTGLVLIALNTRGKNIPIYIRYGKEIPSQNVHTGMPGFYGTGCKDCFCKQYQL